MDALQTMRVDVRDMLCAQALAVVGDAIKPLRSGDALDVVYNAEDVKQDLIIWASDRGYDVRPVSDTVLRIAVAPNGV